MVEETIPKFTGDIRQTAPLYSALKIQGKRLYEHAREGTATEDMAKTRTISIKSLELLDFSPWHDEMTADDAIPETPSFKIRVRCGGGTYIRSLIRDIGRSLDSAACMVTLIRSEQRGFILGQPNVLEMEELNLVNIKKVLCNPDAN